MNLEIIAPADNATTSALNWLLAIETNSSASAMEAHLPQAHWRARPHPIVSYGDTATLQGCTSAPFENGPIIRVTFTSDAARVSSVELCVGFKEQERLREGSAAIAAVFDPSCRQVPPRFETLAEIPENSRKLEESWWRGDSFLYQMTGVQALGEGQLEHDDWNLPHEIIVRKFPLATLNVPVCNPRVRETDPHHSPSSHFVIVQKGREETPPPV